MINKDTYKRLTKSNIFTCPNCIQGSIVGEDDCFVEDIANLRYHIDTKIYDRLAELEDKIENGTLHELPCKVGDKVYQLDNAGDIYESEIKCLIYVTSHIAFDERSIGTSIFLTKEQAEARLKELQGENK